MLLIDSGNSTAQKLMLLQGMVYTAYMHGAWGNRAVWPNARCHMASLPSVSSQM